MPIHTIVAIVLCSIIGLVLLIGSISMIWRPIDLEQELVWLNDKPKNCCDCHKH